MVVTAGWAIGLLAVALVLLIAPTVRAADPASVFYYESEPGNSFGHGTSDHITSDEANFEAHTANMGGPGILIDSTSWMVAAAGPGGAKLVPGTTYTNVRNAPDETAPWFDLESQRLYGNCRDVDGEFTVHDVGYVGAWFSRLSLSFAVTCEGDPAMVQGELRFNASAPAFDVVMLSPMVTRPIDLGYATVGERGSLQTFTLSNVGAGPVTVGDASMGGTNASDFEVVSDTCAGLGSLAASASCTFDVRLAPTTSGDLAARASIAVGTAVATRQVDVEGIGQSVTTTTIDGPTGWVWPPVDISALVSPSPTTTDGGASVWYTFPDADPGDGPIGGPDPMMADGSARYHGTIPPGVHRVYAEFNPNGTGTWAHSRSETITVRVMRASSIAVSSSQNPANGDEPPVITAALRPADVIYAGGELVLTDVTTDAVLAQVDVGPGQQEIRIEPFLTAGEHLIRAEYDGYEGVQGSSAELTQVMRVSAGASFSTGKFYPVVDRYRDTLTVEAWRYHAVLVDITMDSVASGTTVRTQSYPPETEDIVWKWDGRDDTGALVPAGSYKVKVTFSDGGNEPKVVSRTVAVSRDKVKWQTKSVSLAGGKYKLSGKAKDGKVSRSKSNYGNGVWLGSGKGSAVVSYAFPVAKADVYGKITFKVRGRSRNGHKALIGIWNPDLGGYKYLGNYDAAKLVGPGYKWWQTAVSIDADRVRNGKVRAMVAVAKGLGKSGPANFDVKSVKLTYEVGTLVKPTTSAVAGGTAETLGDDDVAPDPAVVGRRASEVIGVGPLPAMHSRLNPPRLPSAEDAPDVTLAADPVPATGPASFAFESQRGDAALLTTPTYTFTTGDTWYGAVPWVEISDGQNTWRLAASGPDGARLESGRTYLSAVGYATSDRPFFKLAASGACSSSLCSWSDFTVHDVAYDAEGRFERLSLSFDLRCTAMTGELRFNTAAPSYPAIGQTPFCSPSTDRFPDTEVGENSSPVPRTITNVGSGPVSFGQAGLTGRDIGDFEIVTDTCSNQTLAESASCTLAARFAPSRRGDRNAKIGMSMDFGSGARMIGLYGYGVRATTTTITAPTATTWSPVTLEAQVTPNPAAGSTYGVNVHFEFPDSPSRNTYVRSDVDGRAVTEVPLPPGDHRVYAKFYESDDFQTSQSDTVTVHVGDDVQTSIELTATPTTVVTTQRPTITATLSPPGVSGGELRIEDGDTGEVYGSLAVSPGDQTLTVTPLLGEPGRHVVSARYLAHEEYPYTTAAIDVWVSDDADVDGSVKVEPAVFYPTDDGFRESTGVTIKRRERLAVEARIVADAGGAVHLQTSAAAGTSDVHLTWDGRVAGGGLAPSGYYTLRVKLTDDKPNTKIIERRVVLSHDWVKWTTKIATVQGKNYSVVGKTKDAVVSKAESAYANGVRLKSKKGSATVGYAFPIAKAKLYRDMTFEVEGRSTNGHQAVASIWNPELGGYRDLSHYDAAVVIGPAYAKWRTSAPGAHRVSDGKARGVVSTWNGLGAPHNAVFDIKVVRLHYEAGAIQRTTDWSLASGPRANLAADYLADADSSRKGRTVKWMAGKKLPKWIKVRSTPSSQPKLATTPEAEPTPTADPQPAPTPSSEPEATAEPEPTLEPVEPTPVPDPTSAPQPDATLAPEPSAEPEPTPKPAPAEPKPTPKPTPVPTREPEPTPATETTTQPVPPPESGPGEAGEAA